MLLLYELAYLLAVLREGVFRLFALDRAHTPVRWARAVLVIDPQLVLDPAQPPADAQPAAVRLIVPEALVPKLSAGRHQLGDADEPQNSYVFGEVAEIFEYDFVGPVSTGSGFVSLIARGAAPSPVGFLVRTSRLPVAQAGALRAQTVCTGRASAAGPAQGGLALGGPPLGTQCSAVSSHRCGDRQAVVGSDVVFVESVAYDYRQVHVT